MDLIKNLFILKFTIFSLNAWIIPFTKIQFITDTLLIINVALLEVISIKLFQKISLSLKLKKWVSLSSNKDWSPV